jgi:DNA-directed RNA polymerase specialized sigma24 family protein
MNDVTAEAFARFLSWLGPDPQSGADRYREIHHRLVKIFACWGTSSPEDLADRTLDRVAAKADAVREGYEGDPLAYILGVARNVRREDFRSQSRERDHARFKAPVMPEGERRQQEAKLSCLDRCLAETLDDDERRLLLEYYQAPRAASASRRAIADAASLHPTTLRKRTQRYRQRLEHCLRACLGLRAPVTEDGTVT